MSSSAASFQERSLSFSPPELSEETFQEFQKLIHQESGIHLAEAKRVLLVSRLAKRLRELRLGSFEEYLEKVTAEPEGERVTMFDCITTNETHFFREADQVHVLTEKLCPRWEEAAALGRRQKLLRIWSAGCSTGEEPFTLAMALLERLPPSTGWRLEITATDLSTRVLAIARAAVWPMQRSEGIPRELLKRYMLKGVGSQTGKFRAGPELRQLVSFARVNLKESSYPVGTDFDAIFCRNVLIYFDRKTKQDVVERLMGCLAPDGYLFLGRAECLAGVVAGARAVAPSVYQKPLLAS